MECEACQWEKRRERGQPPPCQHWSEETWEHSGSGREPRFHSPEPPGGGHPRLWDVCSDTPKCPGEHQGRHLMVPAMEETEPIAAGCRQTSKSRSDVRFGAASQWTAQHYSENIQWAQVLTAIASRTSREPREQGRYHCRPSTNPESSPRSPCWS